MYLLTSLFQPCHLVPLWKPLAAEEVTQSDIPKMGSLFSSPHVCFHSTKATKKSQIYFWKHLIHHDTALPLPPHPCSKIHWGSRLWAVQATVNTPSSSSFRDWLLIQNWNKINLLFQLWNEKVGGPRVINDGISVITHTNRIYQHQNFIVYWVFVSLDCIHLINQALTQREHNFYFSSDCVWRSGYPELPS